MISLLLGLGLLAQPVEPYPGQVELTAGMNCWESLDADCARRRLEEALEKFNASKDPHYMEHVRLARWTLALIRLASDDLEGAEHQLRLLLLLDAGFSLPPGEHPPKLRYIFEQAKGQIEEERRRAAAAAHPNNQATAAVEPPPVPPPTRRWLFDVRGRLLVLFGRDQQVLFPGGGVVLAAGMDLSAWLRMSLEAGWARHELKTGADKLQYFSLAVAAEVPWRFGAFELTVRTGAGALATGTGDRYDNFGAVIFAGGAVAWRMADGFSLRFSIEPALTAIATGQSFFLPVSVGGRLEW